MSTNKNAKKQRSCKKGLTTYLALFLIVSIWTPSHAQSSIDSTQVSYYRLGEFAKYVEFKKQGDSLISKLNEDVKRLEIVTKSQSDLIFTLENVQIPNLKSRLDLSNQQLSSNELLLKVQEDYFKSERKRLRRGKLNWGVVGVVIGVIVALVM